MKKTYTEIANGIKAQYGENVNMPMTELRGYIWNELNEENEETQNDLISRVNALLPDYATWYPETSSIMLPIDKADDFDIDWNMVCDTAWTEFCEEA